MNIKTLLFGTFAAAMLASCSSDSISNGGSTPSAFDEEGNGFIKIAINLPTTAGTRAVDGIGNVGDNYGQFNDGDKNEYTVENAILAIFDDEKKTDEMDYKMIAAYDLSLGAWDKDPSNQITTHREIVRKISGAGAIGKLHGYIIINKHNFFSLDGTTLTFNPNCPDPVHAAVPCNGMTFKTFSELSLRESGRRYDANSFLMTNMPYVNVPGGTSNPSAQGKDIKINTLYPLDGAIYPSEAEANAGKPAEINVERVLAKVETMLKDGISTTEHKGYKFKFLGWFIDNTNPNAYIGRHCIDPTVNKENAYDYLSLNNTKAGTYRMVSQNAISPTQDERFRTFWAFDPNYDRRADKVGDHDKLITLGGDVVNNNLMKYDANGENIGGKLRATGSHYYCTENTFDVQHQSVSNTTRIIVAAQFVKDDNTTPKEFYTLDREPDVMYELDDIKDYTKSRIADRASFMMWANDYFKDDAATKFIKVKISDPEKGYCKATLEHISASDIADADLIETDPSKIPTVKAAAATAFNKMIDATSKVDGETGHNEYLAGYKIGFFANGVSYYQALIKHFGDIETPWSETDHAGKPNDVKEIYDNNDINMYLGRYGVVRNNWYKIDVEGIRQIGSPVVPPVPGGNNPEDPDYPSDPDTPDDTVDNFLKVKINITPWAIRKQSVIL